MGSSPEGGKETEVTEVTWHAHMHKHQFISLLNLKSASLTFALHITAMTLSHLTKLRITS